MDKMHSPPHPGEVLRECLPEGMTVATAAQTLQVSRSTLSMLLNGNGRITASLALRLSAWLATTPDVWLGMQTQFDLWQARQAPMPKIQPLQRIVVSDRLVSGVTPDNLHGEVSFGAPEGKEIL